MRPRRQAIGYAALVLSMLALSATAQPARELTIALGAPPASFDPHFFAHAPSFMVQQHVFEPLVWRDAQSRTIPVLATRWEMLPENITPLMIVPERIAREAQTTDFNSGRAAIGSGPFRLAQYTQGERVILERNPAWRGTPSPCRASPFA